jgi:tetratricopeptide (TPR) repeat protein
MKKKLTGRVKQSPPKGKRKELLKSKEGRVLQMSRKAHPSASVTEDPAYAQAMQNYRDGLRALQERKFERAKSLFQKVINAGAIGLVDRAAVHLNTCNQHLEQTSTVFRTPEEHYDYAVSLINIGEYVEAREHLEKILKQAPNADYAWYGMAVLECLTGHAEPALRNLAEAIRLKPSNRFQARNDSDFRNLADDPRFTELLYPESTESDTSSSTSPRTRP